MMFHRYLTFLFVFVLSVTLQSCLIQPDPNSHWERIEWLNAPAKDSTLAPLRELPHYEANYSEHDAVYMHRHYSCEHVGDISSWDYYEVSKLRYIVLNPEEEWLTTFQVQINNTDQTLDSIYLTITSPEGVTKHFGKSDLIEESKAENSTSYKFVYPDVKKGSMIEEGYVRRTTSLERGTIRSHFFRFKQSVPIEQLSYKYIYPASWMLMFKKTSEGGLVPTDVSFHEESNARILSMAGRHLAAWEDEPWAPYQLEVIPYLEFFVSDAKSQYYYFERPNTWAELMKRVDIRLEKDELQDLRTDAELKELTEGLIGNVETNIQKADTINSWVQNNLALGNCRKCKYDDVLDRGMGSFKHHLEIAMAMLEHAGFSTKLVMIHSASEGYFDPAYLTTDELLSPGIAAVADGDTLVVYPHIEGLPAGLLPAVWQERPAIYIDEGNNCIIGKSPRSAVTENTQEEEYALTIDDEGLISVRETKYYRGLSAYLMRSRLKVTKESEMDDFMEELLSYDEGDVTLEGFELANRDDYRQPLIISLEYKIDNLVTVTPEEVIFQTGGLFSPSSERKRKIETEKRKNPIRIYADELVIKRISIDHPAEWTLDTKLKAVDFSNHFGELEARYRSEPGQFVVDQRRLLKRSDESKDKIEELMQITGLRSQLQVPTLIFTVNMQ